MPIYSIQTPDGKVLKVEGPENATSEDLMKVIDVYNSQIAEPEITDQAGMKSVVERIPTGIPGITKEKYEPSIAGTQPEPTTREKLVGAGEAALSTLTGATTGALGYLGGAAKGITEEAVTGQFGQGIAEKSAMKGAEALTYAPRTETGQEYVQNVGEVAQQLVPVAPLAGEMQAISTGLKAPGTQARLLKDQLTGRPSSEEIKADPYNADFSEFKIVGDKVIPDKEAGGAIKQGWRPSFVSAVKASSDFDKDAAKKMLDIFKKGRKNDKFRSENRPGDVVGETFNTRVNALFNVKKRAVHEIDSEAEKLKGKQVDYSPAIENFENSLRDLGVTIIKGDDNIATAGSERPIDIVAADGKIKLSLRGSDIEGDKASKAILKRVFDRLGNTDRPDGYDLHRAKRWLDTQVEYGKKSSNGLLNSTENIIKKLRRDINESLGNYSSEYKRVNTKYKDSLDALEAIQQAVGRKTDLTGENVDKALGQESRKLLSNYQSRINMLDAINRAEDTAKKYGVNVKGDIVDQIMFANEIDHMFGAVAPGTFKGQISSALESGLSAAKKTRRDLLFELLGSTLDRARGINDENAIKSIETILNRKDANPSKSIMTNGQSKSLTSFNQQ